MTDFKEIFIYVLIFHFVVFWLTGLLKFLAWFWF